MIEAPAGGTGGPADPLPGGDEPHLPIRGARHAQSGGRTHEPVHREIDEHSQAFGGQQHAESGDQTRNPLLRGSDDHGDVIGGRAADIMARGVVEAPHPAFGMIDLLLRDRGRMLARIRAGVDLTATLRTMIATIAVTMAVVGAALGSYRGGVQIAYAAIKLPLVLLGTAALSAPALSAVGAALGRRSRLSADLALVMSALAFGALLLVACTPLVMLGRALDLGYHRMILSVVAMFAVAGVAALRMIWRGVALERAPGWRTAVASLCVVFSLVGGQLSWALRPYLVRPRTPNVPFLREVEGSLFDAVTGAMQSARGVYERDHAPLRSWRESNP